MKVGTYPSTVPQQTIAFYHRLQTEKITSIYSPRLSYFDTRKLHDNLLNRPTTAFYHLLFSNLASK